MKKYEVIIKEELAMAVEVEAESEEEAVGIVEKKWKNSDVILDWEDFNGVEFICSEV